MRKKWIAILLSALIVTGNIGTIPVLAADHSVEAETENAADESNSSELEATTVVESYEETAQGSTEEVDEKTTLDDSQENQEDNQPNEVTDEPENGSTQDNENSAQNDEDIENKSSESAVETVEEELQNESSESKAEASDEENNGDTATDSSESSFLLNIEISFSETFKNRYQDDDSWNNQSTLVSSAKNSFDDGRFYLNAPYTSLILGSPQLYVASIVDGALKEIEGNYDYVDVSKDYYLVAKYSLADGFIPSDDSSITVDGESVNWSCHDNILEFNFKIIEGREHIFELDCESDFEMYAGDIELVWTADYSYSIKNAISSDEAIANVDVEGNYLDVTALKPGKATITVTGKNGSVGRFTVTVKSFLEKSSIVINSGSTACVNVIDEGDVYYSADYASSSNKKVASAEAYDSCVEIKGKYPGTAVITVEHLNGISTVKVTVKPALNKTTTTPTVKYGSTSLTGKTTPGAKVVAKIGKKYYKATAASNGKYTIKIPIVKIGTKIYLKYTSAGTSLSKTIAVKKCTSKIETTYWTYQNSTRVRGRAKNVHIGDYIKVTVNGKTYKKKVTKNASTYGFSISIKKPGKYGIRLTTSLYNKYNQYLASEKDYVYKGNTVYVGDTKSTVRWLTGWNDPVKKNYYTYEEQWCYDWSGDGIHDAYLYFRNNRVTGWQIYDD